MFHCKEVVKLVRVNVIMEVKLYEPILFNLSNPSLEQLYAVPFHHDTYSNHQDKKAIKFIIGFRWTVTLMKWPPHSPDLKLIDSIWFTLDSNLRKR